MTISVRVPTQLRDLVGGAHCVDVDVHLDVGEGEGEGEGDRATVQAVLDALAVDHPALERRIRDERGAVRTHVNLFVGADNVRDLDGTATAIAPGQELSVIPAVSGG